MQKKILWNKLLCLIFVLAVSIGTFSDEISAYGEYNASAFENVSAGDSYEPGNLITEVKQDTVLYAQAPANKTGVTAAKSAQVLPDGETGTGSEAAPVPVGIGNEIKYTITVNSDYATVNPSAKYDIIFLLDWSGSMNYGYEVDQAWGLSSSARLRAKDTILEMSRRMFANYPDSRIAVMGLNAIMDNSGIAYTNLQIDTDFVGKDQYETTIKNAYDEVPREINDDNSTFLRAAIDKLRGYTGDTYYNNGKVNPRKDQSRIPVIVHITDMFMLENVLNTRMIPQVRRFKELYEDGIYLFVRTRHWGASKYPSEYLPDSYYEDMIAIGGKRWKFITFTSGQTQIQQDDLLWEAIGNYVPVEVLAAATIADVLPEGLEYVNSSTGGIKTTVDGRDAVTWDISELPKGQTTVTVTVKVKEPGIYINKAAVNIVGHSGIETNKTYHKAEKAAFHFKKIDAVNEEALEGAEFKLYGWEGAGAVPDLVEKHTITDGQWKLMDTQTSKNEGKVSFELLYKTVYQLVETKAPTGYLRPAGQWRIMLNASGKLEITGKGSMLPPAFLKVGNGNLAVTNFKDKLLPMTGSAGITNHLIIGLCIMISAIVFFLFSIKRRINIDN